MAIFERYTEGARRALFFARARTSERDGDSISSEDLLAGIILAAPEVVQKLTPSRPDALFPTETGQQFWDRLTQDEEFEARSRKELPFSRAATQAVALAVQEADALGHRHVHPEHLILALGMRDRSFCVEDAEGPSAFAAPPLRWDRLRENGSLACPDEARHGRAKSGVPTGNRAAWTDGQTAELRWILPFAA